MQVDKLSVVALARALGISRQAVYKLARNGMPITSIEAAVAWRASHLDPSRTVANPARRAWRAGANEPPAADQAPSDCWPPPASEAVLNEISGLIPRAVASWRECPTAASPDGERLRELLLMLSEEQFGDVVLPEDFASQYLLGESAMPSKG